MRLTIGPHPAAVYWRRRAVVAVGIGLLVLIVTYACSGSSNANGANGAAGDPQPTSTSPRPTSQQPVVGHTPTPTPTPTPYTLPSSDVTGPCTDEEVAVTATASSANVVIGTSVTFTIAIRNTSNRTCARDVGSEPQELRLLDATSATIVWSSDDCAGPQLHDVESLAPRQQLTFSRTWTGYRSRSTTGKPTCGTSAAPLDPGDYQLVARLDKKLSSPYVIHIGTA
jgi:hypothetical protein